MIVGCGVVIIIATCTPVILAEDAHHALLGDIRRAQDRLRAQHALVADIRQAQDSRRAHLVLMAPLWIRMARELHLVLNVQREGTPTVSLHHARVVRVAGIRETQDSHRALLVPMAPLWIRQARERHLVLNVQQEVMPQALLLHAHLVPMAPSWIRQAREPHLVLNVQREGMPRASLLHAPSVL